MSDMRMILVAMIALTLAVTGICITFSENDTYNGYRAVMTGVGPYNSITLDIGRDVFDDHGISLGDCIILDFPHDRYKAHFVADHSGFATFDIT